MAEQNKPLLTQQQMIWGGAALGALVLIIAGWFLLSSTSSQTLTGSGGTSVVVTAKDRTLGNPKAPIVMVEYASLTCSHCARFGTDVFPKLQKKYIDTGKVYYIYRDFPLDRIALQAAALAQCVSKDGYFHFLDLLFRNQDKWAFVQDPNAGLVSMARQAGLGEEQANACMANQDELNRISKAAEDGQAKYSISGTPTFVVDGTVKSGEFSWEAVQAFLDPKLAGK